MKNWQDVKKTDCKRDFYKHNSISSEERSFIRSITKVSTVRDTTYEIVFTDNTKFTTDNVYRIPYIIEKYVRELKVEVTRDDVIKAYERYTNFSCKPNMERYKVGHIIDEEKSVKWNREEVERNYKEYEAAVTKLNRIKSGLHDVALSFARRYIGSVTKHKLSKDDITRVWNKCSADGHSGDIHEIVANIDELCYFICGLDAFTGKE